MIVRAFFAFVILCLLLPHEPNLGLPRVAQDQVGQIFSAVHATLVTRASQAVGDLRRYNDLASLHPAVAERADQH